MNAAPANERNMEATRRLASVCATADAPDAAVVRACVSSGADVCWWDPKMPRPILHTLAARGAVACVAACLETRLPIDFTLGTVHKVTLPHLLCYCATAADAQEMLRLVVDRLERHPEDSADWSITADYDLDFLSLAANHQRLSLLWPLVRNVPYFADRTARAELQWRLWDWDWEALGAEEQVHFEPPTRSNLRIAASRVTGELVSRCHRYGWRLSAAALQPYVEAGADLGFSDFNGSDYFVSGNPELGGSILHYLVWMGNEACVRVCLRHSTRPIDFTLTDSCGKTLLHRVCGDFMPSRAVGMLQEMLRRMDTDGDASRVEWLQKDEYDEDFLSSAADSQLLSVVWPLVRERVVAYLERQTPCEVPLLPLSRDLWKWDWDLLGSADQKLFKVPEEKNYLRCVDRPTAELAKMCVMNEPDPDAVQRCVDAGGNVNGCARSLDPILNRFLYGPSVASVAACLRTKAVIDFTAVGSDGWTAVHFLCYNEHGEDCIVAMLRLVVERLRTHPNDIMEWNHSDNRGYSIFHCIEWRGLLPALWPVLRDVDHFAEERRRGPIRLSDSRPTDAWIRLQEMNLDSDFCLPELGAEFG